MARPLRPLSVGFFVVFAPALLARDASARQYSLTPIPRGDYAILNFSGMNSAGQVTGMLFPGGTPAPPVHGYVWGAAGGTIELGEGLVPTGIGDNGAVVGHDAAGNGFLWTQDAGIQQLTSLPGGGVFSRAFPRTVNGSGQILAESPDGGYHAFVYNPDGTSRLLPLPATADGLPFDFGTVSGLNNRGDAVGWIRFYRNGANTFHGIVWPAEGGYRLLDDVPGGENWSQAGMIDGRGDVAGLGMDAGGQRAVVWAPDGRVTDLGTLTPGTWGGTSGINDAGEAVGFLSGADPDSGRAFFWTESEGLLDLNTLLDASGAGWTLRTAQAINNAGQILVLGRLNGAYEGALLTPVPEPRAVGLCLGAGFIALRRRHRGTKGSEAALGVA